MKTLLLGDSHMQVLGPLLKRALPDVAYVYAKPGWSVKKWALNPPDWKDADLAIIALGGNDRERDPKRYEADVRRLLESGRRVARFIWVGPSVAKGETGVWHERTRGLQAKLLPKIGVRWIDSSPWTSTGHRADGVHFSSEGYQKWARGLVQAIGSPTAASGGSFWGPALAGLAAAGLLVWTRRRRGA